jgi:cholesterol transport system auxiliary component
MTLKKLGVRTLTAGALLMMAGCSGFRSDEGPTQVYTIDPVFEASKLETPGAAPSLRLLRPLAAPGLDNERIALRRGSQQLDYYAASRWPTPLPEFVQSLAIEALRASGKYRAVQSDGAAFAADEVLQIEIRRFQAEYNGAGAPLVHVQLLATLGSRTDRKALASVSAESSVKASENRMQAVVAAFQSAATSALTELVRQLPP